jgi:hypothetical protein
MRIINPYNGGLLSATLMETAAYVIVMFIAEKGVQCIVLEGRLLSYMLKLIVKGVEFLVKRKRKKTKNVMLII